MNKVRGLDRPERKMKCQQVPVKSVKQSPIELKLKLICRKSQEFEISKNYNDPPMYTISTVPD